MTNSLPYIASGFFAFSSFIGQVQPAAGSWHSLAIQAGMAGVVVLLLLKFFPMLIAHLERKDQEHQKIVREIVTAYRCTQSARK